MARSLYWQAFKVFYRFQGFCKLQSQKNKNEFWNSTSIPLISMDFVTFCYCQNGDSVVSKVVFTLLDEDK